MQKKKLRESSSFSSNVTSPPTQETNDRSNTTEQQQPVEEIIAPSIDFVLRRHPQETLVDCLKREYIRTSSTITIKHIKTFLSRKLNYEHENHFQVSLYLFLIPLLTVCLDFNGIWRRRCDY